MSLIVAGIALILIAIYIYPRQHIIEVTYRKNFESMTEVPDNLFFYGSIIIVNNVLYEHNGEEFIPESCFKCNKC